MSLKVLGIDPGYERVGYGCLNKKGSSFELAKYGLIQTPRIELSLRLEQIHQDISRIIAEEKPDVLAHEKLFFTKNQTTGMDVAKALGCIVLAAAQNEIPVFEYSPPQVKQSVVGVGSAEKKQVQFMVAKLLGLPSPPKPDDVADALAVAITHHMRATLTSLK